MCSGGWHRGPTTVRNLNYMFARRPYPSFGVDRFLLCRAVLPYGLTPPKGAAHPGIRERQGSKRDDVVNEHDEDAVAENKNSY